MNRVKDLTVKEFKRLVAALPSEADECLVVANAEYYVTGIEWDGINGFLGYVTGKPHHPISGPKLNIECQ